MFITKKTKEAEMCEVRQVELHCDERESISDLNICRKIINGIMCDDVQQKRFILSKLSKCFAVDTGSEKKFKQILAEYRLDLLALIVEENDTMIHSEKTVMSIAKTTILLWEKLILGDEEVGTHSSNIGTTEFKAGTVRLVRTVSDAVQELGWAEDGQLVPFETFLVSKREFDEVPLSPAGVYSIHYDMVEFVSKYRVESSLLAAVAADLEVQQFKAGCRALGLIFKLIIDPLWRVLTSKGNMLEMELRYQTLVTKLNGRLFDDIEVPKDLVLDRLTMWTDPDFFELTIQIVELILASFLEVCGKMPVDLEPASNINDRCGKDLGVFENLQKARSNAVSVAFVTFDMFKKTRTWEWLRTMDKEKKTVSVKFPKWVYRTITHICLQLVPKQQHKGRFYVFCLKRQDQVMERLKR
ncbi:unnamed protein product [Coregonus sp. 'balchen']|nr:unnamed protein product [Coregonus sp. 'balchen']